MLKKKLENDEKVIPLARKVHAENEPDTPFTLDCMKNNKSVLLREGFMFSNPRDGYISLYALRGIFEVVRSYYLTCNYYFFTMFALMF